MPADRGRSPTQPRAESGRARRAAAAAAMGSTAVMDVGAAAAVPLVKAEYLLPVVFYFSL